MAVGAGAVVAVGAGAAVGVAVAAGAGGLVAVAVGAGGVVAVGAGATVAVGVAVAGPLVGVAVANACCATRAKTDNPFGETTLKTMGFAVGSTGVGVRIWVVPSSATRTMRTLLSPYLSTQALLTVNWSDADPMDWFRFCFVKFTEKAVSTIAPPAA